MLKLNFQVGELLLLERTLALMFEEGFSDKTLEEKVTEFLGNFYRSRGIKNPPEDAYEYRSHALNRLVEHALFTPESQLLADLSEILTGTDKYGQILRQTQELKGRVEEEWSGTGDVSLKIMQDVTGLEFDNEYSILINHPSDRQAYYIWGRRFVYGIELTGPNSNTIGLWHEIMHGEIRDGDVGHGIIQLTANNELRVRLNGGKYPPLSGGFPELYPVMERMLPDWDAFLSSPTRNIVDFSRTMKEKYGEVKVPVK